MAVFYNCPECGTTIGEEVEVKEIGETLLLVGNSLTYHHHAYCKHCHDAGKRIQLHWDSKDVIMRRLTRGKVAPMS